MISKKKIIATMLSVAMAVTAIPVGNFANTVIAQATELTAADASTRIKVGKDNVEATAFDYGDTITVKVLANSTTVPTVEDTETLGVALFATVNDVEKQLGDAVASNGSTSVDLTYDTATKVLPTGDDSITLTVKWVSWTTAGGNAAEATVITADGKMTADATSNLTANITLAKKQLTIADFTAEKVYDGTAFALTDITLGEISGLEEEDEAGTQKDAKVAAASPELVLTANIKQNTTDVNVNTDKSVTVEYTAITNGAGAVSGMTYSDWYAVPDDTTISNGSITIATLQNNDLRLANMDEEDTLTIPEGTSSEPDVEFADSKKEWGGNQADAPTVKLIYVNAKTNEKATGSFEDFAAGSYKVFATTNKDATNFKEAETAIAVAGTLVISDTYLDETIEITGDAVYGEELTTDAKTVLSSKIDEETSTLTTTWYRLDKADDEISESNKITIGEKYKVSYEDIGKFIVATVKLDDYDAIQTAATGEVEAAELTLAAFTADSKEYDGTQDATLTADALQVEGLVSESGEISPVVKVSGEFQADGNAGNGKTVKITNQSELASVTVTKNGESVDITDRYTLASNWYSSFTSKTYTAAITKKEVTVSNTGGNFKLYATLGASDADNKKTILQLIDQQNNAGNVVGKLDYGDILTDDVSSISKITLKDVSTTNEAIKNAEGVLQAGTYTTTATVELSGLPENYTFTNTTTDAGIEIPNVTLVIMENGATVPTVDTVTIAGTKADGATELTSNSNIYVYKTDENKAILTATVAGASSLTDEQKYVTWEYADSEIATFSATDTTLEITATGYDKTNSANNTIAVKAISKQDNTKVSSTFNVVIAQTAVTISSVTITPADAPKTGVELTANAVLGDDFADNTPLTYQWIRGDSENITSNGTSKTYTPVKGDIGKTLKVKVTAGDGTTGANQTSDATEAVTAGQAAKPTFNPVAGEVTSGTKVAITSDIEDAVIYYSLGASSDPTAEGKLTYSEPIEITAATTIKAYVMADGYTDSEVATAAYTIKSNSNVNPSPAPSPSQQSNTGTSDSGNTDNSNSQTPVVVDNGDGTKTETTTTTNTATGETTEVAVTKDADGNVTSTTTTVSTKDTDASTGTTTETAKVTTTDANGNVEKTVESTTVTTADTKTETVETTNADNTSEISVTTTNTETSASTSSTVVRDASGNAIEVSTTSTNASGKTTEAEYDVTSGTNVTLDDVSTTTTKIAVPATVKAADGTTYKVTAIAKNAAKGNKTAKTVTIGSNVKKIGASAFANCTKVTKATIGKNVTSIAKNTFKGDSKLKTVTLQGAKVTSVGKNAFSGIAKNATITIKGTAKQVKKVTNLIKKSGVAKTVTIKRAK